MKCWQALLCWCLVLPFGLYGQEGAGGAMSNLQQRYYSTAGDTLLLDTLSVTDVRVEGVADTNYVLLAPQGRLIWRHRPRTDRVRISYRRMGLSFTKEYAHKNIGLVDSNYVFLIYKRGDDPDAINSLANFNQLEYSGTYGRSIALGNNQDVVLNSNFNLQASGYILDSVRLEAAITDNTIPFQPEGNTQRLQEFDQVYIRLQKNNHDLTLGDYILDDPPGYFLNFYKRVQGVYYRTAIGKEGGVLNKTGVSGSIAKGQFARNIFQGQEGNQGPYKLTGNNGEQFFIVLAGTERVYVDDVLMERGENADYIINYNTGEIMFMPRKMITKDSRIQVEFEYQDRNYLNSLIYAWDELHVNDKLHMRLNAYSNQDAKNQPYLQNLSGDQKRFLSQIGDSIQDALYPVINTDTFGANKILYKMIDTLVDGMLYDSVFVYSTNPDSAIYTLSFSFVGQGRGDYIISSNNANGRVYDWIAPQNGVSRGSFAPVQLLVAPKMQQVFSLTTIYDIDSFKKLNVELAASNTDPNLYSDIDNQTHWGGAVKVDYGEKRFLGNRDSVGIRKWQWSNNVSYEYVQDNFRGIAPYRNVEFGRDWNVPLTQVNKPDEHLASVATELQHQKLGALAYAFSTYQRGEEYNGYRNILAYSIANKRIRAGAKGNLLTAVDTFQNIRFFRPSAYAEYYMPKLMDLYIGGRYDLEHNELTSKQGDTLTPTAFSFDITKVYLKTAETRKARWEVSYFQRRDRLPKNNEFVQQSHSDNYDINFTLSQWQNHEIGFTGTYRKLIVDDTGFNAQLPEETLLGRLQYTGNVWKGAFSLNTLYEFGSGQEQKREFTYIEVPAGQGIYTWNDYNGDGVQQANEFEIAIYQDQKRFIKVFTPTNEYVRVHYINFNQSVIFEPSAWWSGREQKGWQKFVSRFSDQFSLQIANRLLSQAGTEAYNPFISTLEEANIINTTRTINNSIYFNRTNAHWGIDYNYLHNAGKQLLTYGVEGNTSTQHLYKLRWNMTRAWTLNLSARQGERAYQSALNDNRTYNVGNWSGEPALVWLHRSILRITAAVKYEERQNAPQFGGELAKIQSANLEIRYTRPAIGAIQARGIYTNIEYNGEPTAPVTFIMLDALQKGQNYLWYMNWDRRVAKGIEISLEYEGRLPAGGTVIHTGRMTVRAVL